MSHKEIKESLNLLEKDWEIDPILRKFMLGEITDVSDYQLKVKDVIFHIPFLKSEKKFILWKCFWPDCHNCCNRQGRLPLTSDDLIKIGNGLKYQRTSDFVKNETVITTWEEKAPSGNRITMTTVNLKRRPNETEKDDGTHVSCRFLNDEGYCGIHPDRPGVCYLYPFSSWLENENKKIRVHATFQFTGDCPGFYLSEDLELMKQELIDYSKIIFDYSLSSSRTVRENFSLVSFH